MVAVSVFRKTRSPLLPLRIICLLVLGAPLSLSLSYLSSFSFRSDVDSRRTRNAGAGAGAGAGSNQSTSTDAFFMGAEQRRYTGRTRTTTGPAQSRSKIKPCAQLRPDPDRGLVGSSSSNVLGRAKVDASARNFDRRRMLSSSSWLGVAVLSVATGAVPSALASTGTTLPISSLQDIAIGQGVWTTRGTAAPSTTSSTSVTASATFSTYATRFLIQYDEAVTQWWSQVNHAYQLLPADQRQQHLGRAFGSLAKSIQQAFDTTNASSSDLYERFLSAYGDCDDDARRQIALLFSLLPPEVQPIPQLDSFVKQQQNNNLNQPLQPCRLLKLSQQVPAQPDTSTTLFDDDDLARLLPNVFHIVQIPSSATSPSLVHYYTIQPAFTLYEIGIGSPDTTIDHTNTAVAVITATSFGPLASTPLMRDRPDYSFDLYGWLGIAGALACCLTHAIVIPLDVVKTRAQTSETFNITTTTNNNNINSQLQTLRNKSSQNLIQAAMKIAKEEGMHTLLLGGQATLVGYFWYGLSVYPSYTFAKRTLSHALSPEFVIAHGNELALVAGAIAAIIASLGLTPLEAARIRAVANPSVYRPLGLVGTLQVIANENMMNDSKSAGGGGAIARLYAGLPSLLARQVIFGSIKFLAFEQASEFIFGVSPGLRDATWTTLAVSLAAGGLSGILSSVVSQPADCLLTYVAAKGSNASIGLLGSARTMMMEEGPGCFFRGLGSRCVWAGSIIAGQFLLYDVFRTLFGVNSENLNQVFQLQV